MDTNKIVDTVMAFVSAASWAERKRLVKSHSDLLLNDIAEYFLAVLIEQLQGAQAEQQISQACALVLRQCRERGIDAAFESYTTDIIIEIVQTFINVETWNERRKLVEDYGDDLLSDGADILLRALQEGYRTHHVDSSQHVAICRQVLQHCRTAGADAAFADLIEPDEAVRDAVMAFLFARSMAEQRRILEANHGLLLTAAADQIIDIVLNLEDYRQNIPFINTVNALREVLMRCRRDGIEKGFAEIERNEHIREIVISFMSSGDWSKQKVFFAAHIDDLLSDAADLILRESINYALTDANPEAARKFESCRQVLARCRSEGIEAGFARNLRLMELSAAIRDLERPEDSLRKAQLCREAFQLADRDLEPEIWAGIRVELVTTLTNDPVINRGEALEEALTCAREALEVLTPAEFPALYPEALSCLASVYLSRIHGNRAGNLEQALELYQQVRYDRAQNPISWADNQVNIGVVYSERILGYRAENLEQAIQHLHQALQVSTLHGSPPSRALAHHNLGKMYRDRVHGDQAQNFEQALYHLNQAIQIYSSETTPHDWAGSQNSLGLVYAKRILGDRDENLEQAIAHYVRALEVFSREHFPRDWAMVQHNLGGAYTERIRGEPSENQELALFHFQQALEVITRQELPEQWASIIGDMSHVYRDRLLGDPFENVERAIDLCRQGAEVYTREAYPIRWALLQSNLGTAYVQRGRGDQAKNYDLARHHLLQSLDIYTEKELPHDWAMVQINLGILELHSPSDDDTYESAIERFRRVQERYTESADSQKWASIQYNLGLAYHHRVQGSRAENLEQAIQCYQQALKVYRRDTSPYEWATTQTLLARTYFIRQFGEPESNLNVAITLLQQALDILKPETAPQLCLSTAYLLGLWLMTKNQYTESRTAFELAHQSTEFLRGQVQRDLLKRMLSDESADLYKALVSCCLLTGDLDSAFRYAAAGKGRAFVDTLTTARFDLAAAGADNPELAASLQQARALRKAIDQLFVTLNNDDPIKPMLHLSSTRSRSTRVDYDKMRALQRQETELWEDLAFKYPALTATQTAPVLTASQACALAADLNATLVEYYCHLGGWCAFVVTPDCIRHTHLPKLTDDLIARMQRWTKQIIEIPGGGLLSYTILREWHGAAIAPLQALLHRGETVIMAPFGLLHTLPLSAAYDSNTQRFTAQDYQLSFAPSLSALWVALQQTRRLDHSLSALSKSLLSIAYPGLPGNSNYLQYVISEAQEIAKHFDGAMILTDHEASPDAVITNARGCRIIHFSCHGIFDDVRPEQSGLLLADGRLTVQRIIAELHLEQTELLTLGVCLGGQTYVMGGDEQLGITQSMLTAGARTVVSALWKIDDAATRAFFEQFYIRIAAGQAPILAFQEAVEVIRNTPGWSHPYYWSSYQINGLPTAPQRDIIT